MTEENVGLRERPVTTAEPSGLIRYEAMCRAISECARVDEAKDIRDKAVALEVYARQAKNHEAEREAASVRMRAEHRVGELLKELPRATAPNPAGLGGKSGKIVTPEIAEQQTPSPYAQALTDNKITTQEASAFQRLADVPAEALEAALASEKPKAAVKAAVKAAKPPKEPKPPKVAKEPPAIQPRMDWERERPIEAKARALVRAKADAKLPLDPRQIAAEAGVSHVMADQAIAVERALDEARADWRENPPIDPASLSMSAQQKLERVVGHLNKRMDRMLAAYEAGFNERVRLEVLKQTADRLTYLEERQREEAESRDTYNRLTNGFAPLYTMLEFRKLQRVMHSDAWGADHRPSEEMLNEAFNLLTSKQFQLTKVKP